jgi:plasmid stabilization system protein ParE
VSWRLIVEADAETEITEAAAWYQRVAGERVQRDFLDEVAASLAVIENNPLQYQVVRGAVRRAMIGRFPYALLYSVTDNDVVVTVCIYGGRDPRRWHSRFPP